MGVYIDMEMPKKRGQYVLYLDVYGDPPAAPPAVYMADCVRYSVFEVPEPHGRLGDLDRLEQMFADIDNAPYSGFDGTEPFYSAEDAAQIIRLAPTIIQAGDGT